MLEKELAQIDGMRTLLQQQQFMIENASFGGQVFEGLKTGQ